MQFINRLYANTAEKAPVKPAYDKDLFRLKINEKGQRGFLCFLKMLKGFDKTGKNQITLVEIRKAIKDFKLAIPGSEIDEAFKWFDADFDGRINIIEFVKELRGLMSEQRKAIVAKAYGSLLKRCDNSITMHKLKEKYIGKLHPAVIEGRKTQEAVYQEFTETIEIMNSIIFDGNELITEDKFNEYYEFISSSIEKNEYFETMMYNVWQIELVKEVKSPVPVSKGDPKSVVVNLEAVACQNVVNLKKANAKSDAIATFKTVRSILISRGIASTINFIRQMRIFDNKKKGTIDCVDFVGIFNTCKLGISEKDITSIKQLFENAEMRVSIEEFYNAFVGDLHPHRAQLVLAAYKEIDKVGLGYVDINQMNKLYNSVSKTELQTKAGKKMTTDDIIYEFREHLDAFLYVIKGRKNDGRILKDEFVSYYTLISSVIDDDSQFDSMMTTLWNLKVVVLKQEEKPAEAVVENPKEAVVEEKKEPEKVEPPKEPEKVQEIEKPKEEVKPTEEVKPKEEAKEEPKQISNEDYLKAKIIARGVRAVFGLVRGLKSYDISGKGIVTQQSFAKFLSGYFYADSPEEAAQMAYYIIKEECTIFDVICSLFGDQTERRSILDNMFANLKLEEIDADILKEKIDVTAEGAKKDEDTVWGEYIDTIEEYMVTKGVKDRKIKADFFIAYHVLYTLLWDIKKVPQLLKV